MARLIVGCGYLGSRVARLWHESGETVHAVTRSNERAVQWQAAGWLPIVADVTDPTSLEDLPPVETVLFAVGFDRASGKSLTSVYVDGLRHLLDALPSSVRRVIYISSTGVYGQVEGDWVDETTPCHPQREGGRACLAAERMLEESRWGGSTVILRLAGIYGPQRILRAETLRAGEPIDAPAEGWLNLIHVDDAATIVDLVARDERRSGRYVVSDGEPVARRIFYESIARHLGAPSPRFVPPAVDSPAALRAASDKRVRPERLFRDYDVKLRYPSYREGIVASVARPDRADPAS